MGRSPGEAALDRATKVHLASSSEAVVMSWQLTEMFHGFSLSQPRARGFSALYRRAKEIQNYNRMTQHPAHEKRMRGKAELLTIDRLYLPPTRSLSLLCRSSACFAACFVNLPACLLYLLHC